MKNKWKFLGIVIVIGIILGICVYKVSQTYLKKQIAEKGPALAAVQMAD